MSKKFDSINKEIIWRNIYGTLEYRRLQKIY